MLCSESKRRRCAINEIWEGLKQAALLLWHLDPEVMHIVGVSLRVSGTALLFSAAIGIPLGAWLGFSRFVGRRLVVALLYTGMGFPPVVVGLFVYLLLSQSGPLGSLNVAWIPRLFTVGAMVVAQVIISFPLVAGFTMAAVKGVDPSLRQQLISLGATEWQATLAVLREARFGVIVSVIAGFGSIISEVGAVMLVGGNIEGSTRVLTTAIVLETRRGNFSLAIALALILLSLSFLSNILMLRLQGKTA
ncbi:MAG: ABC transporter permease [Anaerolineales bacterium]